MARVPEVLNREDVVPVYRYLFDEIVDSRGGVLSGPFRVLLHSPVPAARAADLGAYIRFESTLPAKVTSISALAVGREYDCVYEWTVNEDEARSVGVRDEAIDAIKHRRAPEGLMGDETLVWKFTTELLRSHRISEDTWQAAVDRFGLKAVTDLVASIGYFCYIACALNAFDVDSRPELEPTLPV